MQPSPSGNYYRLIALWVVCEAFIGGIIHGLHIPVSGLIVGSAAVTCISLIAWYHPKAGSIIRATIVVLIFKMLLSPQAPVTAYVAVLLQGAMGELMFRNRKHYGKAVILFAVIALLESAFQRFLILMIIYGADIWTAINFMLNKLTGQQEWTNYSRWFIVAYTAIHFITGLLLGIGLAGLPKKMENWKNRVETFPVLTINDKPNEKRKGRKNTALWISWITLILLLIQSNYGPGSPLLPQDTIVHLLLRSLIIISSWILLLGPFMKWALQHWLKNQQGKLKTEVKEVMQLLPETKQILRAGFASVSTQKGFKKYGQAIKYILVRSLYENERPGIYILCAPVGSGKTTSLQEWVKDKEPVYGVLSPVINGKRFFQNLATGELFPMEAEEGEQEVLRVGCYIFSKRSFERAASIIDNAISKNGWLIIDEVGPLELRGEGLSEVVLRSIKRNGNTIIVIRKGLEEQVMSFLQASVNIFHSVDELPV